MKRKILPFCSVLLAMTIILLTASCGADVYEYEHTTIPPITNTFISNTSTTVGTAVQSSTVTNNSTVIGTATRKISFTYTGKVAQKQTIAVEADYLSGYSGMRDVTARQIVLDMRSGITISNFLDTTTKMSDTAFYSMVLSMKYSGFNAVRIPVNFEHHIDANTYTIDSDFLQQVQSAVDAVIKTKMYCILSLQNETGWLTTNSSGFSSTRKEFTEVWKQLASRFKSYSDYLLFEGYSELQSTNSEVTSSDYSNLNLLASAFVSTIRSSGGNNEVRHLIVSSYGSLSDSNALNNLSVPKDSVKDKIIVDIHLSLPPSFVGIAYADENEWGTQSEKNTLDLQLYLIYYTMTAKRGYPVIIGKYGAADKNNTDVRALYASYFVSTAYENHMTCFWNDDGNVFRLYDRTTGKPAFNTIIQSIIMSIQ